VFDWLGFPAVATVSIQGTTTTSAADGSFTIAGVTPPYGVVLDAGWGITGYVGLTRPDPSLLTPVGLNQVSQARVEGTFDSAVDAGTLFGAVLDLPGTPNGVSLGITGQPLSIFGDWAPGSPDAAATLWGFQAIPLSTGGLGTITAVGSRSMTLQNGVNVTGVDLALSASALSTATLSGTFANLPPGYQNTEVAIGLGAGSNAGVYVYDDPAADAGSFAYGTFTSTSLRWSLVATAVTNPPSPGGGAPAVYRTGLVGSENLSIEFPSCDTAYVSPTNGATTTPCTSLSWTATPSSVYDVEFFGPTGSPSYELVTDQSTVPVPFALSSGQWSWTVTRIDGIASLDALAESFAAGLVIEGWGAPVIADHVACEGPSWGFTVP
jgi:hypothetical protein